MLFLARGLAGILSSATLPTTMAYISDTTAPQERGSKMGKLGAAMGLGVILGPGLGGWLAGYGLVTPFLVAAGLSAVALILVIILLPESKSMDRVPTDQDHKRNATLHRMSKVLMSPVGILFFLAFLVSFGMTNFEGIFSLYSISKLNFSPRDIGTVLVIVGLVSAIVQGLMVGPLTAKFGETVIIKVSLLAVSIGFIFILQATSYISLLVTTGLFITPVALLRASVNVLIANRTESGQGTMMGLSNAFSSLGRMFGPVWAGFMFDLDMNYPFLSGAAILFAGFLFSLVWLRKENQAQQISNVEFPLGM
jgi:DHA1 family multidrug resistance protein-like MFS transporter